MFCYVWLKELEKAGLTTDEEKEADMGNYVFYIDTEEIESIRNLRKCFPEVTLPSLLRS